MKKLSIALLAALLACAGTGSARAQTLLLEYKFDSTGTTTANGGTVGTSGTVAGAATVGTATGVSGTTGDYAFSDTGATMGGTGGGIQLSTPGNTTALTSYTLTGWFNSATVLSNAARLFDNSGLTLRADVSGGTSGALFLTANGQTLSSAAAYTATNSWQFFAVTVTEATDNNSAAIAFYIGDKTTSVSLVTSGTLAIQALTVSAGNMALGNRIAGDRAYSGLLDDMRLYGSASGSGSALSLAQLETLRLSDLSPVAVPEPRTYLMMGVGAFFLLVIRRRAVAASAVRA